MKIFEILGILVNGFVCFCEVRLTFYCIDKCWLLSKSILSLVFKQVNVKYLPGTQLGKNVIAEPDLHHAGMVS